MCKLLCAVNIKHCSPSLQGAVAFLPHRLGGPQGCKLSLFVKVELGYVLLILCCHSLNITAPIHTMLHKKKSQLNPCFTKGDSIVKGGPANMLLILLCDSLNVTVQRDTAVSEKKSQPDHDCTRKYSNVKG